MFGDRAFGEAKGLEDSRARGHRIKSGYAFCFDEAHKHIFDASGVSTHGVLGLLGTVKTSTPLRRFAGAFTQRTPELGNLRFLNCVSSVRISPSNTPTHVFE